MQEIWKDIAGYEGLYQVSSCGRVVSLARRSPQNHFLPQKLRVLSTDKDGYQVINLCKEGKVRVHKVHRLVAEAFLDNPHKKPQVNHISGDKMDNHVSNLEWCTGSENIVHSFQAGLKHGISVSRYGEANSHCKVTDQQVEEIRTMHRAGIAEYKELATMFNLSVHQIGRIVRGEQRQKGSAAYG